MSNPPPSPPADLGTRKPSIQTLKAGAELRRFHAARDASGTLYDSIFFDKSKKGRFNDSAGTFGVLYAAATESGAFAESFLRTPGRQVRAADFVSDKAYARLKTKRELRLIRVTGKGLAPIGATAQVTHSGLLYDVPQAWSTALHDHEVKADGIVYTARHDDEELCYAIFERAKDAIVTVDRRLHLDDNWFWQLAEDYDVGRAPS